ncbi:DNA photolyase [Desulfosarcina sp. OttesenSCG-928-A07]|nr:DNA photolyase [Desulfosarcina sp. OttesenSCG-928-G17]MDL2329664.1 DNA photolyase [Desulfosarcina sp. OttesenSCG-928-A07]
MIIKHLFVDNSVRSFPETVHFLKKFPLSPEYVDHPASLYHWINGADDPVSLGKSVLYLTKNRGGFLKACPGTREYICCDYQILHVASFCTMDCSYCILQSYFHPPMLQFFVNREDLDEELSALFKTKAITRVGTGEFTDSLIWENWTDLTEFLVDRFSCQNRAVLELKTKTVAISRLKSLAHNRKTILSWSLNTPRVIRTQERGTSSLDARLSAAATCQQWGYPLAFHFDPMVIYKNCEVEYGDVVKQIFQRIAPESIAWISIGAFRFMPALKPIISHRFPESKLPYGEFVTGLDNKMRYFKPLRIGLYRQMASWIKDIAPEVTVYFCMEDDEVWEKALGIRMLEPHGLGSLLDQSASRVCGVRA